MKTCQGRRNYRFDVIFIIAYLFNISMTLLNGLSQLLSLPSKPTGDVQSLVRDFIFDKKQEVAATAKQPPQCTQGNHFSGFQQSQILDTLASVRGQMERAATAASRDRISPDRAIGLHLPAVK